MGKQGEKKKNQIGGSKFGDSNVKKNKGSVNSLGIYDEDTAVFISMSQELKDEGNKLFQKRDYEGAMFKYEKAIKLLPGNHIDVSHLRSNMAACYMQMGLSEYPRAIHECNLALEVTPKYSKALLKRARCYEALNRLDLAVRDVSRVLQMEPNNVMATEIADRVKATIEQRGVGKNEVSIDLVPVPEYVEPPFVLSSLKGSKQKARKKEKDKIDEKKVDEEESEDKGVEIGFDEVAVKDKRDEVEEEKFGNGIDVKNVESGVLEAKAGGEIEHKKGENRNEEKRDENVNDEMNSKGKKDKKKGKDVKISDNELEDGVRVQKAKNKNVEKKAKNKAIVNGVHEANARGKSEEKKPEDKNKENKDEYNDEDRKTEDKLVVEESTSNGLEKQSRRMVKLIFGEDIRWAQIPINCSILELREIIRDRFPSSKSILIKYRDQEGDLVTITTYEELRWAEASVEHGSLRLYIVHVNPDQDPFFEEENEQNHVMENGNVCTSKKMQNGQPCIDDWIVHFAHLFKNYVGFESDTYLDLHEVGMKLYSEAMEETVTSEEAQDLFLIAAEKFQEMAALALFNWGNIHMSRARKKVYLTEESTGESVLEQVKSAYVWAQKEYSTAGRRYEEALKIKPDFYEGVLAMGLQQFEQAKLSWYYAISNNADLESWPSTEVFQLYNYAEVNMERGMEMWEEEVTKLSKLSKTQSLLQDMKLDSLFKEISVDEAADQAANMRSQINLLWGLMLYERSIMEFKLGLPIWQESLEVAVEKFELAGASPTDIVVMIKNHCSNTAAPEGIGFNIDEIVQAWNEMYEAKRCQKGVPSFRLEPLLRRRVSKLYHALELA